ncbi:MAG: sigma-70 family RNA polymerase sigma factor [Myxococcota bacterium]
MSLAARLLEALDRSGRDRLSAAADLESALGVALQAARAQWPRVRLSDEAFATALAERLDPATVDGLQALRISDLYVATACVHGDPQAIERVTAEILRPAVRAALPGDPALDDVLQRLAVRFFVGVDGAPGRVAQYGARGSLKAWTRVAVLRAVKDLRRGQARAPKSDGLIEDLLVEPGSTDPEIDEIRSQCSEEFRAAFATAVEALDADDRRMLRQHHLQGATLDHLAKLEGVHRVTAARRLARARRQLLDATKAELATRLRATGRDVESLLKEVGSRLEVSVDRLLASRPGA